MNLGRLHFIKQKGFNLLEVGLTAAAVGFLALNAIPSFNNVTAGAAQAGLDAVQGEIVSAAKVNQLACETGVGTCVILNSCNDLGLLLEAAPSGLLVEPGDINGTCSFTANGLTNQNVPIPGLIPVLNN